jgi:hypothetical protein
MGLAVQMNTTFERISVVTWLPKMRIFLPVKIPYLFKYLVNQNRPVIEKCTR